MASTSRPFDSRSSATTSARDRVLINAAKTEATAKADLAKKEEAQRTAPVTGTLAGYDATVGAYLFTTPDGGTIRAQLLSDGAPTGLQVPLQRFGNSQTCAAQTRPSGNTGGNVISQIEAAQRDVINLLANEALDFRIEAPEATTYTLSAYQHYDVRIEALEGVAGATVVTSPVVGEVASVGTAITITLSALADPVVPVLGSILLRRVV